mgnify:CR=1 FL=1
MKFLKIKKNRTNNSSFSIDWHDESERLLVSQIILKISDINAPLKEKELHVQWTNRIVQEFYEQVKIILLKSIRLSHFILLNMFFFL